MFGRELENPWLARRKPDNPQWYERTELARIVDKLVFGKSEFRTTADRVRQRSGEWWIRLYEEIRKKQKVGEMMIPGSMHTMLLAGKIRKALDEELSYG